MSRNLGQAVMAVWVWVSVCGVACAAGRVGGSGCVALLAWKGLALATATPAYACLPACLAPDPGPDRQSARLSLNPLRQSQHIWPLEKTQAGRPGQADNQHTTSHLSRLIIILQTRHDARCRASRHSSSHGMIVLPRSPWPPPWALLTEFDLDQRLSISSDATGGGDVGERCACIPLFRPSILVQFVSSLC